MSGPFDKARYAALLEGLEITVAKLSDVLENNQVFRVDSEYLSKEALSLLAKLHRYPLRHIFDISHAVTDGIHASIDFVDGSGIKLISAKHPKENYFALEGCDEIAQNQHEANPRTALRCGDVIISTVGTIGNAAVVDESMLPANSDRHVGIIRANKGWQPEFISTFLLSKYGRFQTNREVTGNVQPNLFISKLKDLLIPELSNPFRKAVQKTVVFARAKRLESLKLMQSAEQTLLVALGLKDWQPPEPLTYTRSSKEVEAAERFDSEFFKPRFDALISRISRCGTCVSLESLLSHNQRGKQPVYAETGLPVVNSKQVLKNEVVLGDGNACAEIIPDVQQIRLGDVIINGTGVGTIGRAAAYLHNTPTAPDNHVTILRIKNEAVDPVYLSVYLNSIAGQIQVNKWLHGSSGQTELYPSDIAQFQIWLATVKIQKAIRKMVEDAFKARNEAQALLSRAQRAVEIAIEEGEAAGMRCLERGE